MTTRSVRFPPSSVPQLATIAQDAPENIKRAFLALETFLKRLASGQVQGQDSIASPTLDRGDMIYNSGGGDTRLPAGNDGQFLGLADGIPTWQDLPDRIAELSGYDGLPVMDPQLRRTLELLLIQMQEIEGLLIQLVDEKRHG